ncbi:MAG: hypothetical protein LBC33_00810 [Mycoplasmataceae bacterium]|jgi:hypothetical protein|nr:hypothetical protein [Mycoplasmataceae bacterium]
MANDAYYTPPQPANAPIVDPRLADQINNAWKNIRLLMVLIVLGTVILLAAFVISFIYLNFALSFLLVYVLCYVIYLVGAWLYLSTYHRTLVRDLPEIKKIPTYIFIPLANVVCLYYFFSVWTFLGKQRRQIKQLYKQDQTSQLN